MQKLLQVIGIAWMAGALAWGMWLGVNQLFFGGTGIIFDSGYGDMWLVALAATPGYFLWHLGTPKERTK